MKPKQTALAALVLIVSLLYQCNVKEKETSIFITKLSNSQKVLNDSVQISYLPKLGVEYLLRSKLDSTGGLTAKLEIRQPTLATISLGSSFAKIFLKPGESISMTFDSTSGFSFRNKGGTLGHFNNHLNQTLKILNTRELIGKDPNEFFISLDSIEHKMNSHATAFRDSIKLNSEDIEILDRLFDLSLQEAKIWYAFMHQTSALVEQIYAFREGKSIIEYQQPKAISDLWSNFTFDTAMLNSNVYGEVYKQMLWSYSQDRFSPFDVKLWNNPNPDNPFIMANLIKDKMLPKAITEYLQALNIHENLREQGITKVTDSLYRNFETEFPQSKYTATLSSVFIKQGTLSKGKPAPNIRGTKIDGTVANLTDFKGRIVYIDIWATWCAPCVEEIPHSIELQNYFKDDPNIIFLNVSADKDVEAWKRKITLEKNWGGVHINLNKAQVDSLGLNYELTGYPTYIIINKDGKIITTRAQRPSSTQEIKTELERLSKTRTSF